VYDEPTIRAALDRLSRMGWVRLTSGRGSRAAKYRHLLDEALGVSPEERALLCLLMLRGPQTLGELKQRSERLHSFPDLRSVEETLDRLTARELGRWLERQPGQKEARFQHLLGEGESGEEQPVQGEGTAAEAPADGATTSVPPAAGDEPADDLAGEVARLQQELEALRREVDALRADLGS
jgi:uncharacterized protein